jgi:hypothetical protein
VTVDVDDWDRPAQPSDPYRWEAMGLGGARWLLPFGSRDTIVAAVMHLMSCHDHHFAVVGEQRELVVSGLAVDCLHKAGLVHLHRQALPLGFE